MSETSRKGEQCPMCAASDRPPLHTCVDGSLFGWAIYNPTPAERSRCRPSTAEAAIYGRGGYVSATNLPNDGERAYLDRLAEIGRALNAPSPTTMPSEATRAEAARRADAPRLEGFRQGARKCMATVAEHGDDMVKASDIYERLRQWAEYMPGDKCEETAPAVPLGEAVVLANRAESLAFEVLHSAAGRTVADDIVSARVLLTEAVKALTRAMASTGVVSPAPKPEGP